jgi:hypothetical protein|tara:strand:- start:405 stop:800 length:396 start_codon:yes stop_codon:yes gene_type:complete
MEINMETTMHQNTPTEPTKIRKKRTDTPIADLIKYTPDLESYIIDSIITKCGKPAGYEGKYKFSLYEGWDVGNCQRGRVNFYHKVYYKKKDIDTMVITSYFFTIKTDSIGIHTPESKGIIPCTVIDYPTNG